jgi:hypothetical protein
MSRGITGTERKLARIVEALSRDTGVTIGDKKGFGSGALKVNGKIFTMTSSKRELVVKLPRSRIDELLASGRGRRFEPRPGDERVACPDGQRCGLDELANEARHFVKQSRR